jgi:2'-5' RNA ligase
VRVVESSTLRLFVAIELPAAIRDQLRATTDELRSALAGPFRWVPSAAIHLTLRFLGDTLANEVDTLTGAINSAASGSTRFSLRLEGAGSFPQGRSPSVLWAGLGGGVDALQALRSAVESTLATAGIAPEKRAFQPHLTLARVRGQLDPSTADRVRDTLASVAYDHSASFEIRHVSLMRSELLKTGARHTRLGSAALGSA